MARSFNGTSQEFYVVRNAILEPAFPIALSCWVRSSDPGTFRYIVSKELLAGNHASYSLSTDGSKNVRFIIGTGTGGSDFVISPTASASIWNAGWHHLMGTYDGTTVRMYADGVEQGSGTASTAAVAYDVTKDFHVGSFDGTQLYYAGDAAEVTLWNAIPDAAEISALAKSISPTLVKPAAVVAHWPLTGKGTGLLVEPELFEGLTLNDNIGSSSTDHPFMYERTSLVTTTDAGTGSVTIVGSLAGALPIVTGAFAGTVPYVGVLAGTIPSLTGAFTGTVPIAATEAGSWWTLLAIQQEAAQLRDQDLNAPPLACPRCGEPMRSGSGGVLYCSFDGYRWDG